MVCKSINGDNMYLIYKDIWFEIEIIMLHDTVYLKWF